MGCRLVFTGPKSVGFQDFSEPKLGPDQIRVETLYSGISHGTEMNVYRGTAPFYFKNWDPGIRIFSSGKNSWKYPMTYGYEEVCKITEKGKAVHNVEIGDIICTAYGHQTTGVLDSIKLAPKDSGFEGYLLPANINPVFGVFHLLSNVALNGVHRSSIKLGDYVAVFGLGIMGLFVTQFARLSGAKKIMAIDLFEKRLQLANTLGADITINLKEIDAAAEIKRLTSGGVDVAFECSGSYTGLHQAIRSCANRTKVIALGWYQGEAKGLFLGDEFHHNQISIISESDGLPQAVGRRWSDRRIKETFFDLISKGELEVQKMISHIFPFEKASEAYKLIDEHDEEIIKCVLTFKK